MYRAKKDGMLASPHIEFEQVCVDKVFRTGFIRLEASLGSLRCQQFLRLLAEVRRTSNATYTCVNHGGTFAMMTRTQNVSETVPALKFWLACAVHTSHVEVYEILNSETALFMLCPTLNLAFRRDNGKHPKLHHIRS